MSNKIPCGGFYLDDMLNVNDSGELSIKGGTPYQQLVTDGNGSTQQEDRTYYAEKCNVTIIPLQDFIFTDSGAPGVVACTIDEINLVVGQEYTVDFDGTTYVCICADGEDSTGYIGNPTIAGFGENTGEPFFIGLNEIDTGRYNTMLAVLGDPSTHSVSVVGTEIIYHTIPVVYQEPQFVVFEVQENESGVYSLKNATYDDIYGAMRDGKTVFLKLTYCLFQCSTSNNVSYGGFIDFYNIYYNGNILFNYIGVSQDGNIEYVTKTISATPANQTA